MSLRRPPTRLRIGRSWLPVDQILDGDLQQLDLSKDVHPDVDGAFIAVLVSKASKPPHVLCLDGAPLPIYKLLYGMNGEPDNDDNVDAIEHEAAEESAKQGR